MTVVKGLKGFKNKVTSSISKWESSHFGGFYRVITDHPWVKVDWNVDFKIPNTSSLLSYEKIKLLKIFLAKVNKNKLSRSLLVDATSEERKFAFNTGVRITVDRSSIITVLNSLIKSEPELGPLFEHYSDLISKSEIFFDIKDEKEEEAKLLSKDVLQRQRITKFLTILEEVNEEDRDFYNKSNRLSKFAKLPRIELQDHKTVATSYNESNESTAMKILNLLDIDFDPKSDIVKSLRIGKLDVGKIAEVPAGNLSVYEQKIEQQATKPFSIVILADESGSMSTGGRIGAQYQMVKSLYLAFSQILPEDKIFVYGHSGRYSPELFVYHDIHHPGFDYTIDRMMNRTLENNYDGPIVEKVHQRVRSMTSDRIIFISLSDGRPNGEDYGSTADINDFKRILEKCKRDDFVTIGVGIQTMSVKNMYQYTTIVQDLNDFAEKTINLVNHVVKTEFQ